MIKKICYTSILGFVFLPFYVFASNSHSIDIERTSSQFLHVDSDLGINFAGNVTLECWLRPEIDDGFNKTCVSLSDAETDVVYSLYHDDGFLSFKREKLGVGNTVVQYAAYPTAGTWWHVVGTYDGTNLRLYQAVVGGTHTLRAGPTAASGSGSAGGSDRLKIGGTDASADTYYDGLVDDVRVWSTVRDTTALDADFEEELCGTETGLLGYWKLNNSLVDDAGSNDLTNNASAVFSATVPFVTDGCSGGGSSTTTTSTTTVSRDAGDVVFGLAVLIFLQSMIFLGLVFKDRGYD